MGKIESNGWRLAAARRGRVPEPMPIMPPAWETLLESLVLTEEQAERSRCVKAWVMHNYRSRFVPVKTLEACGITDEMCELGSGGFNRRV